MSEKKKLQFTWRVPYTGFAAGAIIAALLAGSSPTVADMRSLAALTIAGSMLFVVAHAYRFWALLCMLSIGLAIGLFSSLDFLRYDVEGEFAAVASTIAVFLLIALLFGGFAECVRFVHRLTHGRRYEAEKSVPK